MKYAAAITFFNPTDNNIKQVCKYSTMFDFILIYDNSESQAEQLSELKYYDNIIYFYNSKNDGLPVAYNFLLGETQKLNIDFMCTLDQDSEFLYEDIIIMKSMIESFEDNELSRIGIIAPFIDYSFSSTRRNNIKSVEWVITSGAFLNLRVIRKNNIFYDEYYFIDRFDIDFCKQVRKHGLKIIVNENAVLNQRLGTKGYFGHSQHSPFRHYYIARNRYYYNYKYFSSLKAFELSFLQTIKHILVVLFFESDRFSKIRNITKGIYDYRIYEKVGDKR